MPDPDAHARGHRIRRHPSMPQRSQRIAKPARRQRQRQRWDADTLGPDQAPVAAPRRAINWAAFAKSWASFGLTAMALSLLMRPGLPRWVITQVGLAGDDPGGTSA